MAVTQAIKSQYLAALGMMKQAVERCPESIWDVAEDKNKFWRVAYHALFYTHLYLQKTAEDFKPWVKHKEEARRPGTPPEKEETAYTKTEILEYLAICQMQVAERTASLDLEAPSGFEWLPFDKLELQFYNLRHLQQHVGELYERLGTRAAVELDWVSLSPEKPA